MNPANRLDINYTFEERYKYLSNMNELARELDWLKKLKSGIKKRLGKLKQPTKHYLKTLSEDQLSKAIKAIEGLANTTAHP